MVALIFILFLSDIFSEFWGEPPFLGLHDQTTPTTEGMEISIKENWFDENWKYRKLILIDNSTSAVSNYQLKISTEVLRIGQLISEGKIQPDLSDIRFVSANSEILPHYYESLPSTSNFWIKMNLPQGTTNIYFYYGNPSASSTSNIKTTFLFADDFDDGIFDSGLWEFEAPKNSATYFETSGNLSIAISTPGTLDSYQTTDDAPRMMTKNPLNDLNVYIEARQINPANLGTVQTVGLRIYVAPNCWTRFERYGDTNQYIGFNGNENANFTVVSSFLDNSSEIYFRYKRISQQTWEAHYSYDCINWISTGSYTFTTTVSDVKYGMYVLQNYNDYLVGSWDWFRIRKYISPEPALSVGEEETIYFSSGVYLSNVVDTFINGCTTKEIIWGDTTDITLYFRASDSSFSIDSPTPSWGSPIISSPYSLSLSGRYQQFKAVFSGDGISTPLLKSVTVEYLLPDIILEKPLNGSTTNQTLINFKWSSTALKFKLEISEDETFSDIYFSTITSETEYQHEIPGGRYYWTVKALDKYNNEYKSSQIFSFTISPVTITTKSDDELFETSFVYGLNSPIILPEIQTIPLGNFARQNKKLFQANPLVKKIFDTGYKIEISTTLISFPFRVSFRYDDSDDDGFVDGKNVPIKKLRIFSILDRWIPIETKVDRKNRTVFADVYQLATYALFGCSAPVELIEGVVIFPNPANISKGERVAIRYSLKDDSTVILRIYNLVGDLVYQRKYLPATEGGKRTSHTALPNTIYWDGKNNRGRGVAVGMYILELDVKSITGERKRIFRKVGIKK